MYIFASTDVSEPIYSLIGQQEFNSVGEAEEDSIPEIRLNVAEWAILYRVIYQRRLAGTTFTKLNDLRSQSLGSPINNTVLNNTSIPSQIDGGGVTSFQ
jgi:hypothetical protein